MEKIPVLDLKKQIAPIRQEIDAAIKNVIDNTSFVLGKEVDEFENDVKMYCKVRCAVGVSNGTDAIKLALVALGIKPGDGVICPTFTYFATAGAIAAIGAVPVFADIDPMTYNISLGGIINALKNPKVKIKAIIPVHLYGQCADMDGVLDIAKKNNLKVIEDNAQAFGAEYTPARQTGFGKKSGTIGDCGTVSFFPGKNLGGFGDAGMVLTDNPDIESKLKILRNQGNKDKYHHLVLGFNNRLDTIQAAILKVKLKYLDDWNKRRRANADYYNHYFKSLMVKIPFVPERNTHIYHQYTLRLDVSSAELMNHLNSKDIDARVYYPVPLHLQECFKYLGYRIGDFPESEKAAEEVLSIPVYPDLTQGQLDYIVGSVKEFFGR
ncbi:MAG: DegT/DnrJ/EryC1/StrS family aminotransferase [Candidatus Omnitrophota bacterium]